MANKTSASIAEVVTQVKKAVQLVQRRIAEDESPALGVELEKVDLTLKAFAQKEAGLDLKVSVPIVDKELGLSGALSRQETQTIELTLLPIEQVILFGAEDVSTDLAEAVLAIKNGLARAAQEEPKFGLENSSVELNFVVGREGDVSLVARGGLESETTHTMKLYLRRQSAGEL